MQSQDDFFVRQALREALRVALASYSRAELAAKLTYDVKTLKSWESGQISNPVKINYLIRGLLAFEQPPVVVPSPEVTFTFIDLFAGIGGTRLGFQNAGGRCVFTSEYDKYCVQTYKANFRPDHAIEEGDIRAVDAASIPEHDVLVAGFPCQPFSIAGVSKKNALGRAHGFECDTQGTLFFDICRILKSRRPTAFVLENVRNLKSHDKGKTFEVIMRALHDLGYKAQAQVIDAKPWVPQHRERVFIVGFRHQTGFDFSQVNVPSGNGPTMASILHAEDGTEEADGRFVFGSRGKVGPQYALTEHLWGYLQDYAKKHRAAGNGFGYGLVNRKSVARTLSARYFKDGSEILVERGRGKTPRRLTPRECARLMGFPDSFKIPVSDTQAYKQFGNSVVVPAVRAVAEAIKPHVIALKAQYEAQQVGMPI
jgi:DNA (cytosine-5)-methyltransferase 1